MAETPQAIVDIVGEDIVFTDDFLIAPNGDYVTATGRDMARQAVLRRLTVRPGEYRVHPEYGVGISSFVKKPLTSGNLDQLRQRIVDQLGQEPTIEKVLEVTIDKLILNNVPGVSIFVAVQAFGQEMRFEPFTFVREP